MYVYYYINIISNTSPKNMKQKLTELKGKTDTSIIIDFNISLSVVNRKARQKITTKNQLDLIPMKYSTQQRQNTFLVHIEHSSEKITY